MDKYHTQKAEKYPQSSISRNGGTGKPRVFCGIIHKLLAETEEENLISVTVK